MANEPRTTQKRALELLRATLATPSWLPTTGTRRLVWAIRCAVVLGILVLIASAVNEPLWDWLDLLIIPAVLAGGGLWFNQRQQARAEMSDDQRAQDAALQAYLDKMSELLIDKKLHKKSNDYDETRLTARAHTLAVLEQLDEPRRKRVVLMFLREARLINRFVYYPEQQPVVPYYAHYVGLADADLSGANLKDARLISTSEKEPISLKGANLKGAELSGAILRGTDLRGADLSDADLSGADLGEPDLKPAELPKADLSGANLSGANLSGAIGVTNEELEQQAKSLKGAIMPDGQKYEDWLRSTGRREDGESGGTS